MNASCAGATPVTSIVASRLEATSRSRGQSRHELLRRAVERVARAAVHPQGDLLQLLTTVEDVVCGEVRCVVE